MNLRKLAAAGATVALMAGTLGLAASPALADDATSAVVSGTVTLGGKPVKKATVRVVSLDDDWNWVASATTDANGSYSLTNVTPGTWTVLVDDWNSSGNGTYYQPWLKTYAGNTVRKPDAKVFTFKAGKARTVNIALVAGATVKGKVVDKKGKPVKGASVFAWTEGRTGDSLAETDAKGNYVLHGLPTGRTTITASKYDDKSHYSSTSVTVKATQGKTVKAGKVVLSKAAPGTIKATVKGLKKGDSVYLYDTKMKMLDRSVGGSATKSTLTIKEKVAPGTYRLVIKGTNIASKAFTVKSGKTTKVATLKGTAKRTKVTGTVKGYDGKSVKGAFVAVIDSYGSVVDTVSTSSKGKYSVSGVVSGKYTVHVETPDTKYVGSSASINVKKGKNAKKNVKLGKAYTVKGTVKYGTKAVAGVVVKVLGNYDSTVSTDAKGKFTLKGVPKGTQRLMTMDPYEGGYLDASKTVKVSKNLTWNPKLKK